MNEITLRGEASDEQSYYYQSCSKHANLNESNYYKI